MQEFWAQTSAIIFGGAILALLTFVAALMWNLRRDWILDHAWQKEAQKTLEAFGKRFEDHGNQFADLLVKLGGMDTRLTNIEHPIYPIRRPRAKQRTDN